MEKIIIFRLSMIFFIFYILSSTVSASIVLDEGLKAESNRQWEQAVSIYLQYLENHPDNLDIWLRVADIEHQLKQDVLAIDAYRHAIAIEPHNPVFHKKTSELYASMNKRVEALAEINLAIALSPDNVSYLYDRIKLANWNQDNKLVLETSHQILRLNPNDPLALKEIQLLSESKQQKPNEKSPFEIAMDTANKEAMLHHYTLAIAATKKALEYQIDKPKLYKQLSELYAMSQRKKEALFAINQALRFQPNNIVYLRAKASLASWNDEKQQALDTYLKILRLHPLDEDAMLNVAHTLASLGKTDEAIVAYEQLLKAYPRDAEGWIQYGEVLTWTGRYIDALNALKHYESLKGKTRAFYATSARIYAQAGYYRSALMLNEPQLNHDPNDAYLLSTEIVAQTKALQKKRALMSLSKLNQFHANEAEVKNLTRIMRTSIQSNVNLEADYAGATDTTRIIDIPISGQYFLTPITSLLLQGLYERASASVNSGLANINGHTSVFDESARIGFNTQFSGVNVSALAGGLKIQQENQHGIYEILVGTNLAQSLQLTYQSKTDLFRPYLVPQTPRSISLQVMENRNAVLLLWQPCLQKYLNIVSSFSTLSDNNNYWHNNIWPKARVYGSEKLLVSVGADADLWNFARRATDGYYSPRFFQGYEGTVELYYGQSEDVGLSLMGGFGMQKDELLPHFFYEEDINASLFYGLYQHYQIQLKAGYTLRVNNFIRNYQYWSGGVVLTKRFG